MLNQQAIRLTWIIPFIGVDKPSVEWIYAGDSVQYPMDQTTRPGISTFALSFVDEKLEKLDDLILVFE